MSDIRATRIDGKNRSLNSTVTFGAGHVRRKEVPAAQRSHRHFRNQEARHEAHVTMRI